MSGKVVVVGDVLLDRDVDGRAERLCPDAPVPVISDPTFQTRPGGGALAACIAAASGAPTVLIAPVAADRSGERLRELLREARVELAEIPVAGRTPEKIRIMAGGRAVVRLDLGAGTPEPLGPVPGGAASLIGDADAVLVSDYGRGVSAHPGVRRMLTRCRGPLVWDPHPRGSPPVPGAALITPNRSEAALFSQLPVDAGAASVARAGARLMHRWATGGVAVTLGERGAMLVAGAAPPLVVPAAGAPGDTCGAGDAFAAAATVAMARGSLPSEAVVEAVKRASAFVAAGGVAALKEDDRGEATGDERDPLEIARSVSAHGGTVVAAGGCFDILHTGHLSLLQRAGSLGDALVVCLNSDDSIRRLKGPGRPVVPEADRKQILLALECVDAVAVFDEDTPVPLLRRLKPQVFVKGGDYAVSELPETGALKEWGGQVVVLPYLEGRSTTGVIEEVVRRGFS